MVMLNKVIKDIRIRKNLTQDQFAKQIGVATSHVTGWETGSRPISLKKVIAVSELFEFDIEMILKERNMENNGR